ncbi:MAG: glycosyltransferase [Alphaproteobacteria bacterium]|nr:glycosyltransferase [Alphaproteobacteria bacterium]
MKISIVTISLNQASFLERAIRSVIEQDYDDVEYIVVDPGSTDGSRDIIESYRDHIAHVVYEPDKGPADGLNNGFSHASGDVCGYLNADDAFLPEAFSAAAEAFRLDPAADVVSAHGYITDEGASVRRRFRSSHFDPWRYVFGGAVLVQQSTFFRRQAFLDVGGFNPDNSTCWDGELMLDMALADKKFVLVNEYWSVFRIYDESISGSQRMYQESLRNWDRLFEKVMGRKRRFYDPLIRCYMRLEKWLRDPVTPFLRVWEKIAGTPDIGKKLD